MAQNFLRGIGAGGFMKDYRHASNLFRTGNFRLSPKFRFLFHCVFVFNRAAISQNFETRTVGFMVKTVDLPSMQFEVEEHKQYNRKSYSYTGIQYNPVNIAFHDDSSNNVRNFLAELYNYYISDGNLFNGAKQDAAYNVRGEGLRDSYRELGNSTQSPWGLESRFSKSLGEHFLKQIKIISLSRGLGSQYTLHNPIITQFDHGSHDVSDGSGPQASTMSVNYDAVTYQDLDVSSIPELIDSGFYDKLNSSITDGLASPANPGGGSDGAGNAIGPSRNGTDPQGNKITRFDNIANNYLTTLDQIESYARRDITTNTHLGNTGLPSIVEQVLANSGKQFPTASIEEAQRIFVRGEDPNTSGSDF